MFVFYIEFVSNRIRFFQYGECIHAVIECRNSRNVPPYYAEPLQYISGIIPNEKVLSCVKQKAHLKCDHLSPGIHLNRVFRICLE